MPCISPTVKGMNSGQQSTQTMLLSSRRKESKCSRYMDMYHQISARVESTSHFHLLFLQPYLHSLLSISSLLIFSLCCTSSFYSFISILSHTFIHTLLIHHWLVHISSNMNTPHQDVRYFTPSSLPPPNQLSHGSTLCIMPISIAIRSSPIPCYGQC
jgi:hypothetical protein